VLSVRLPFIFKLLDCRFQSHNEFTIPTSERLNFTSSLNPYSAKKPERERLRPRPFA